MIWRSWAMGCIHWRRWFFPCNFQRYIDIYRYNRLCAYVGLPRHKHINSPWPKLNRSSQVLNTSKYLIPENLASTNIGVDTGKDRVRSLHEARMPEFHRSALTIPFVSWPALNIAWEFHGKLRYTGQKSSSPACLMVSSLPQWTSKEACSQAPSILCVRLHMSIKFPSLWLFEGHSQSPICRQHQLAQPR